MSVPMIDDPNGGRSVNEWIGRTPDSTPPPTVLARIFLRAKGCCHISGRKIAPGEPWHAEHVKPLWSGGENRERNLAPALVDPHKQKTRHETDVREKADRIRMKHLGLHKSRTPLRSRGFPKTRKASS